MSDAVQLDRPSAVEERGGERVRSLLIRPTRGWASLQLNELWEYRELFVYFTLRTVQIRYKQTVLGGAWAVLQPLLTMVLFTLVFGRLANMPSDGVPYPIFSYAGLVPWTFFSQGLTGASGSLVLNSNLVKKIYFPRLILPTSAVLAGGIDFLLAFAVLLVMMPIFGVAPGWNVLWLPVFALLALVSCLGVGLWLAAMNVQYRDVKHVVPFLVQTWLFATPIAYSSSMLEGPLRTLYALNPMVGVVEGFRWALLGTQNELMTVLPVSMAAGIALLVSGLYYFRWLEKTFADVI